MQDAYIYDAARTAFGRHGGVLSSVRPDDMLAHLIKTLVQRNHFDINLYEDVIAGNTNQAGEDSRNVARTAGLLAGLPIETGGLTVNRLCGSSLAAALDAARCVKANEGELFVACGVESMSRAPFVLAKATSAFARQQEMFDSTIGARFTNPEIIKQFGGHSMPETADNIASDLHISREACDVFAAASQSKYESAKVAGYFTDEIIPIDVFQGRKLPALSVTTDEHPRPASTLEALGQLRPLFD
ncbi:MAG: 3-oxoadipyl-CoA thiolase, partial [Sinobacterium sp.]